VFTANVFVASAELGTALAARPGGTEAALAAYERALFPRGEASATRSAHGIDVCFRDDAPGGLDLLAGRPDEAGSPGGRRVLAYTLS
jgi:hypothetical protein